MAGYIKLSRSFFDNKIWQAARAFSECEAWLDLIQSARFEASPTTSRIGCYEVTWGRGQYPASNRFLAKKWGRSEQWVKSFLGKLKKKQMITVDNSQGLNIINLVNFDKYNGIEANSSPNNSPNNPPNDMCLSELQDLITHLVTQQVTHLQNLQPTSNPNNKKEKNKETIPKGIAKKDAALAATLSRKENFRQSLVPLVEKYGKEMISAFFDYWSEMNKSQTKMRFEQQPTWEVAKRLATWAKRDKTYENNRRNYTSKQAANDYAMQQYLLERERVAQGVHDETPKPF